MRRSDLTQGAGIVTSISAADVRRSICGGVRSVPGLPPFSERAVPPCSRRHMLAALPLLTMARVAHSAVLDSATVLVAGPSRCATAVWADLILPALAQALPSGTRLGSEGIGGLDGVTAANQFQVRASPDGGMALLLPGSAVLAWLVGDPRARFNAARWVTALAGTTPALVASRLPLARLSAGQVVRVSGNPAGPALAALLALELAGALPQAVPVGTSAADVDVQVLHGREMDRQIEAASQAGFKPVLTLRERGSAVLPACHPDYSEIPASCDWLAARQHQSLSAALDAVIVAIRLDTALVLPPLTSAGMVALWRRACAQAAETPTTQVGASHLGVSVQADVAAVASTASLAAVDAKTLLELRHWLAQRLGWRPS